MVFCPRAYRLAVIFIVLAALAGGAFSADTASAALPEFLVTKATTAFKFTPTTAVVFETVDKEKIDCTDELGKAKGKGTVNGLFETNEVIKVEFTFEGCSYVARGEPCTSAGEVVSFVSTNLFKGEIGYINAAAKEVGMLINKGSGEFIKFTCEQKKISVAIKGAATGKIEPVNKAVAATEHFTVTFKQAAGVQAPANFCPNMGAKEPQLMMSISTVKGGAFREAGIEGTFEIVPEGTGTIEIMA